MASNYRALGFVILSGLLLCNCVRRLPDTPNLIGFVRLGTEYEKQDLEQALEVLYKLKNPSYTAVIYDASGSMRWPTSETDPTPRFEPAQRALSDYLIRVSPREYFGLIVFGHRVPSGSAGSSQRAKACKDIDLRIPIQAINKEAMVGAISEIKLKNHMGDTPLARSILAAVDLLKDQPGGKKIVLVTDGLDECGGEPVAAAQQASQYQIAVNSLAYGIGVNREGKVDPQREAGRSVLVECANASGGLFLSTVGGDELYRALLYAEMAAFTYSVRDRKGVEVQRGRLGQSYSLFPGHYEVVVNADIPLVQSIDVKKGEVTRLVLGLSANGEPEIQMEFSDLPKSQR